MNLKEKYELGKIKQHQPSKKQFLNDSAFEWEKLPIEASEKARQKWNKILILIILGGETPDIYSFFLKFFYNVSYF